MGTLKFPNKGVFQCLKMVFILANSADPNEMPHFAAFHLGLQCWSKCPFRSFQYSKGKMIHGLKLNIFQVKAE